MMRNPLEKQNKLYFDTERVLFTIHMMVASTERRFLKLKYFLNYLRSTIREVKWFDDSIYRKKLLDKIDLDDISDDFISQNVRRYF